MMKMLSSLLHGSLSISSGSFLKYVVLVAFCDFFAYLPTFLKLLLRGLTERFHQDVFSDIPGNPHAFDSAIISFFRTLPEPSNLNVVLSNISLNEPLLVRGCLPKSRISSLNLYGVGSSDPPIAVDLRSSCNCKDETSGEEFEVLILGSQAEATSDRFKFDKREKLVSPGWTKGMVAMRNYLVPPGCRVVTPEIVRLRDGFLVRKSQVLHTGSCYLELWGSSCWWGTMRLLIINLVLGISFYFIKPIAVDDILPILAAGLFVFHFILYRILFMIGKNRIWKYASELTKSKTNEFVWSSVEVGSSASQPSSLHNYALMIFDVSKEDVLIEGSVAWKDLKYWSLIPYDLYGIPMKQYFYDENCTNFAPLDRKASSFDFKVKITNSESTKAVSKVPYNTFYSANNNIAYVMYRIVHPSDPRMKFPVPKVTVVPRSVYREGNSNKKEN